MVKTRTGSKVTSTRSVIQTRNASSKKNANVSASQIKKTIERRNQKNVERKQPSKESNKNNKIIVAKTVTFNDSNNLDKNKSKHINRQKSVNEKSENVSNMRQMSLKESFINQSNTRVLRSFKNAKESKNNLTSKEHNPFNLKDCVVLEKKLNLRSKRLPVYKCVPLESSAENSTEIYEFKFDANDSTEKLPKKHKKKGTIKKALLSKKKKNVLGSHNFQKTEIPKKVPTNLRVKKVTEFKEEKEERNSKEITEKDSVESRDNKVSIEPVIKHMLKENLRKETDICKAEELQNINEDQIQNNNVTKPVVLSVEEINKKKISIVNNSQTSNSVDFRPFRPTNVFKNEFAVQQKNMFNHSLFEKSLSPIKKLSEDPEIASPWRLPSLLTFSQVNCAFQSTPQNKKYNIVSNRFVRTLNNETKTYSGTVNTKILKRNNENTSVEGHANTVSLKKKMPSIARKFGTEITNMSQSLQSNLGESINASDVENIQPSTIQSHSMINFSINNTFSTKENKENTGNTENKENKENKENEENKENKENNENEENKENNMSIYLSPKVYKKKKIKSQSPKKSAFHLQKDEQKENVDPQPGPSGLQNRLSPNNERILRQSNLHNFLNIVEMPQSTVIKTPHRIFDDVCSTPPSTKSAGKLYQYNTELKNAFGFDEEDSDQNILTVDYKSRDDKEKQNKVIQTNFENYNRPLARLSVGEIKNKLLINNNIRKEPNVETEKLIVKKSPIKEKNKINVDVNFSNTFDVLSEMDESVTENVSEVPLFCDYEPTHFKQPPRYSYKRKRGVKIDLSDESDSEEENLRLEHESKRKKGNKIKPEQEKRLMDWVNNINKTFNEVDQYELVIE